MPSETRSATAFLSVPGGNFPWVTPGNAAASDDVHAVSSVPELGAGTSELLQATGFGFNIHRQARIDGVTVEVEQSTSNPAAVNEAVATLIKDGAQAGANRATGLPLPPSDTYVAYGSSIDLWGTTWTPDEINAGTTGFAFSVIMFGFGGEQGALVDHILMTVHYSMGRKRRLGWYTLDRIAFCFRAGRKGGVLSS